MPDLTNTTRHQPEDTTFVECPLVNHDEGKDVILLLPVICLKANRHLIAEQDQEYQDSLLADQKKEEEREQLLSEIRDAEQQEQLRQKQDFIEPQMSQTVVAWC